MHRSSRNNLLALFLRKARSLPQSFAVGALALRPKFHCSMKCDLCTNQPIGGVVSRREGLGTRPSGKLITAIARKAEEDSVRFFDRIPPESAGTPVLVEVPHAGLAIPDVVRHEVLATPEALMRDADIYVDKLYEQAPANGASMLVAHVSRYVVDLNRSADDVDAQTVVDHPAPRALQPRGVVWRMTTDGQPVLAKPLTLTQLEERLGLFHAPYHDAIEHELQRLKKTHGHAILLAAHSMPSVGRTGHRDTGTKRADIVPGTRGRTTAAGHIVDFADAFFRSAGLSVRHDDPYRGGFTTAHYGRPEDHVHAIQIELNRALYVHEDSGEPKTPDFEQLQALLGTFVQQLGKL